MVVFLRFSAKIVIRTDSSASHGRNFFFCEKRGSKGGSEVVVTETIVGEFFVFCAGASVVGKRVDADAAARREESGDLNVFLGP